MDRPVSDWGARVQLPSSSDPVVRIPSPVHSRNERQVVHAQQEPEPMTGVPIVSPEPSVNIPPTAPTARDPVLSVRRSTRATKGQTSKFNDYVTGQDLEDL